MFGRKTKKLLVEVRGEVSALSSRLSRADETIALLRHMLELKTEEAREYEALAARLKERAQYADSVEEKIVELEAQADRFAELKKSLERKIGMLRLQRDEARAMMAAREKMPPAIDFVDPESLHQGRQEKERQKRNRDIPKTVDPADALADWYEPLADD